MPITTDARKPLYAVVGAGEIAIENIKELPTQVMSQAVTIVPKTTALVTELTGKAFTAYGDLVERGRGIVTSIRRSPVTQQAEAQVKTAKAQTKAATTSVAKAAKATAKAVNGAADKIS